MASIDINGISFNYADRGRGLPLVLLHGFPLDSRVFDHQLDHVSRRCRVITPDLRGFGRTRSDKPFSLDDLADDVHQMLGRIDALPCVIGGLSMGGYVSLAFAKKYPNDLKGLVLIDSKAAGDTPEGKQAREKMAETARTAGARAVADQMFPKVLSANTAESQPDVAAKVRTIMEHCPPATIAHASLAMRDRDDHTGDLPSIPVPTLILVGEDDALTPPDVAEAMHRLIPRSVLRVVPDAGHLTPMERPALVSQTLVEFVEKVEAGASFPYHSEPTETGGTGW